jgi:hypothetical protein
MVLRKIPSRLDIRYFSPMPPLGLKKTIHSSASCKAMICLDLSRETFRILKHHEYSQEKPEVKA